VLGRICPPEQIIQALMIAPNATPVLRAPTSAFFQATIMLEERVRRRTSELEAALL